MTDQRRASGRSRSRRAGGRGSAPRRTGGRGAAAKPKTNIEPLHPTLEPPDIESFAEFDLGDDIQGSIAGMGITKPTPIQALAIQPVLDGKDVIAKAETGTGKTLAFGAPMMAKIDPTRSTVLGLVLSPTRELAEQVHDVLKELGAARGVKTTLIVGGEDMGPQVRALQAGAQVVVGTPGRVLDLLNQKFLQFPWTEFAILDEADKMLEIGFIDDVKKILDACNEYRQTLLFSATFPPPLLELARGYTSDPAEIATASGVATVETIHQYFLRCSEDDRARELSHLIEDSAPDDVFLVFCERRTDVDRLMRKLERRRFSVKALHGGYDQAARFRVMGAFRTGEVKCLVATDVASRGLDVKHVTHVVNLGVPRDVSDYTHRIGRTGRAGAHGVAVTFISRRDERDFSNLQRQSGFDLREIERPRELYAIERKRRREDDEPETDAKETNEERPRRGRRRERDDDAPRRERKPRKRREEREEEPVAETPATEESNDERPRRRRRNRDRDDERPTTAAESDDERPRRRRRNRDEEPKAETAATEEERPRRRRRRRSEDSEPEQAETKERETRSEDERPRRERKRRDRDERAARAESDEREERKPRRRRERTRDDSPAKTERPAAEDKKASTSGSNGFGAGLAAKAAKDDDDERPRRRRGGRGRDSDAKDRAEGPKRKPRREDVRASSDSGNDAADRSGDDPVKSPTKGGGFGAGL